VVRPRRRPPPPLGQHFLSDRSILERIVQALDPEPSDVVLEIGAGPGTLTRVLAERVGHVIAIEKDARLATKLRDERRGTGDELQVVAGDALRLDWHELLSATHPPSPVPRPFKVIGNIPYAITSPLIDKALTPPLPERIVFLVQAEVATRLAAAPGSKQFGSLSVGVQSLCHVENLFGVAPGAFRPPPRVHSAVVRLRPLDHPLIAPGEGDGFRAFVQACFSLRRKQLINVLRTVTEGPAEVVQGWLAALGIDVKQRPETLHPHQFVALFRRVGATTLRRSD